MINWNRFVEWSFLGLIGFFALKLYTSIDTLTTDLYSVKSQQILNIYEIKSCQKDNSDQENRIRQIESKLRIK